MKRTLLVTALVTVGLAAPGCAFPKQRPSNLGTAKADLPRLIIPGGIAAAPAPGPAKAGRKQEIPDVGNWGKRGGTSPPKDALVSASPQPRAYAVVIGIDSYRDVVAAPGAKADAKRFAAMAKRTLGIPERNVILLTNDRASRSDITKQLRWLKKNVKAGDRIYFYFSGHGAPNVETGAAYILPWDGDPRFLDDTAISMGDVVKQLERTKAKDVLVMADSCFSGAGGRSVLPPGARPLVRVAEPSQPKARIAVLSAASGAEISGPAPGGNGGLFTSHLIEALGKGQADVNGDGQIALDELQQWIGPRVARDAKRDNREQNPSLLVGKGLGDPSAFIVGWGYAPK